MIARDVAAYIVGCLCYGLSTSFAIRLRDDLEVPTAAALAPAVAFFGARVAVAYGPGVVFIAPLVAALAVVIVRQSIRETITHGALFIGIAVAMVWVGHRVGPANVAALGFSAVAPTIYSFGEVARQQLTNPGHARIRSDAKMWWLLQAVLACASGLTLLVVDRLGWPAFVAMAGVLALTKREFEAFALSRAAYEQTVRAIGRLERVAL